MANPSLEYQQASPSMKHRFLLNTPASSPSVSNPLISLSTPDKSPFSSVPSAEPLLTVNNNYNIRHINNEEKPETIWDLNKRFQEDSTTTTTTQKLDTTHLSGKHSSVSPKAHNSSIASFRSQGSLSPLNSDMDNSLNCDSALLSDTPVVNFPKRYHASSSFDTTRRMNDSLLNSHNKEHEEDQFEKSRYLTLTPHEVLLREKRRRNAFASARFRERRKQREMETFARCDQLQKRLKELEAFHSSLIGELEKWTIETEREKSRADLLRAEIFRLSQYVASNHLPALSNHQHHPSHLSTHLPIQHHFDRQHHHFDRYLPTQHQPQYHHPSFVGLPPSSQLQLPAVRLPPPSAILPPPKPASFQPISYAHSTQPANCCSMVCGNPPPPPPAPHHHHHQYIFSNRSTNHHQPPPTTTFYH